MANPDLTAGIRAEQAGVPLWHIRAVEGALMRNVIDQTHYDRLMVQLVGRKQSNSVFVEKQIYRFDLLPEPLPPLPPFLK